MVKDELQQAQQAIGAKLPQQAAARLRFTRTYLAAFRKEVPYQDMMRHIREARLAIHDQDPLLTATYFRSLRSDMDAIALAMPEQPQTASKALGFLDRAEQAVHFSGKETADWKNPVAYENADWKGANVALQELQQYLDDHTAYVPLDYISDQIGTALSSLQGPKPNWAMARESVGEALTATMGNWVNDKSIQTRWGAEKESADKLDPQQTAPAPAPHWGPGPQPAR